ncbi:MAG: hypothetical protein DRG82_16100 [Deltaproteobacteria bacterium]|nr:MAG: hypothetical protein DRG82_16100 [Deltaproteobacteria bacterium]RLB80653.1 MAG: hypothetical protein DRH15_07390 [Deltaproteobacteria bacterium]
MTKKFSMLFNRSIFVDSNIILYHLFGQSDDATDLLSLGEKNRLRLVTSLRVLDEVLFKVFLWTAREHFGIQAKAYVKLRKDQELAKKVAHSVDWAQLEDFFSIFSVVEPTQRDLWKSTHYSREFGLFGNDALSLCLMKRLNLTYIATADKDFTTINWLKLVEGDWKGSGS